MNQNQQLTLDACALIEQGDYAGATVKLIDAICPTDWDPRTDPIVADIYAKAVGSDAYVSWLLYTPEGIALVDELHAKLKAEKS